MRKSIYNLCLLCIVCMAFTSCVSIEPDYLIKAKSDNGFITAYQAHFAIEGNSITEISAHQYEDLTLGADSNYRMISPETYSFDINAAGSNPAEWKYVQNEYDKTSYDVQTLIEDLKQMKLAYTGTVYVLITTFDEYKIIEAANLDGNTLIDDSYIIFRNNVKLENSDALKLNQLSRFYKHK